MRLARTTAAWLPSPASPARRRLVLCLLGVAIVREQDQPDFDYSRMSIAIDTAAEPANVLDEVADLLIDLDAALLGAEKQTAERPPESVERS